jgi:hypothetical protein
MTRDEAAKAIGGIWPACYGYKHTTKFGEAGYLNQLAVPENNHLGFLQLTPATLLDVLSGLGLLKLDDPMNAEAKESQPFAWTVMKALEGRFFEVGDQMKEMPSNTAFEIGLCLKNAGLKLLEK